MMLGLRLPLFEDGCTFCVITLDLCGEADAYRSENENENGLFWAFPFPFSLKPKLMADGK
jgi:hypothetical protein